jgi:hypothetical protein
MTAFWLGLVCGVLLAALFAFVSLCIGFARGKIL